MCSVALLCRSKAILALLFSRALTPNSLAERYKTRGWRGAGMERIFTLWTSIITPENVEISLDSAASDSLGRMGVMGDVNHH